MKPFSADWLGLREPYDLQARNRGVLDALAAAVADRGSLSIVDLGSGAGASVRALASRLPRARRWRLVDHDSGLLALAASSSSAVGEEVQTFSADLARGIEAVLEGPFDLVTASALLDLVSGRWLDRLTTAVAARGLLVYAALSYDGRMMFKPGDPFDAEIVGAVNDHQLGDKGFGPALGPMAGAEAIARLEASGYAVVQGASDWVLGPLDAEMQMHLLSGWAVAASERGDRNPGVIDAWLERRRNHVASGLSSMRVGHIDFFAGPIGSR